MARERRDIVDEGSSAQAAAVPTASPGPAASAPLASTTDKALARNRQTTQHRDQLLTLVRALARDAARADHAAGRGNH